MRRTLLATTMVLLARLTSADCPTVPVTCGAHNSGNFSPSCTGDFTVGDTDVTYSDLVFSISPPTGKALGATFTSGSFGSAIFILDGSGTTLDSWVDVLDENQLTAAFKIAASGTYSIVIATPDSSSTYDLVVTCDAGPALTDHTMAKGIDSPSTVDPVGRTSTFGSADEAAWSWIQLGETTGIHHIFWSFIDPAGELYETSDSGIGDAGTHPGYRAAAPLPLDHEPAGLLPGPWTVHVTLDGTALVTEHFTLVLESMRPHVPGLASFPIGFRNGR